MTKEIWRERWLNSINELTSLELQNKSWLDRKNVNPHWSFLEFVSCYFDDLEIDNIYTFPFSKDWITKQEFEIIKDWHEELGKYNSPLNDDYDNQAILNDPNWLAIVRAGAEAKKRLIEIVCISEKYRLTEEINYLQCG